MAHTYGGFIPVPPKPSPRPRAFCRGKFPTIYMPTPYKEWKALAVAALNELKDRPEAPLEGPLSLSVVFVVKRPKTTKRLFPGGDVDNHLKSIMDAITESKVFWGDDNQVVDVQAGKRFADDSLFPEVGISFFIEPIE